MKIIGISGSPTKKGNNDQAVEFCLEIAKKRGFETESIKLSKLNIGFCKACGACKSTHECIIRDDAKSFLEKMESADGILISTPVFFGSMTAQLKALLDRTRPLRIKDFALKNKIGAVIAIGGSRNGGQELTIQNVHAFMHIHGMVVVGDDSHFGGIVMRPFAEDDEGMKTCKSTIHKLCGTLEKFK